MKRHSKILSILCLLLFSVLSGYSQFDPTEGEATVLSREEFKKQYEINIKKSRINGVYIPVDEVEAIEEIKALSPKDALAKFAAFPDEWKAARKLYFGLGRWMDVNWSFRNGSRLGHYLKTKKGIVHPDDMVMYLLVSLHRNLNNVQSDDKELIKKIADERKELAKKEMGKVISEEVKKKQR